MILRHLINFMISLNVFAGYFAKKYWSRNTNFSEDYTKGTGLATLFICNCSIVLSIADNFTAAKAWIFFLSIYFIGVEILFNKKINWSVNHFDESGFKDYFFLFWIYLIVGLGSLFMLSVG